MEVFRKYQKDGFGFTEHHPDDFTKLKESLKRRQFPDHLTRDLTSAYLELEESVQPSAQFSDVIRIFTSPIPTNGTVLFLACGRGVEMMRAREVYKRANFIAVEKQLSPVLALMAHTSSTTVWPTDLTDIDPEELCEYAGGTPDLTIVRMPHPRDAFWPKMISSFAQLALRDQKQLLVTNLHKHERERVFIDADRKRIPSVISYNTAAPMIDVNKLGISYPDAFGEEEIEVGHDYVVTTVKGK